MHDEEILACLKRIEAQLASDEYESGGCWTIGGQGAPGTTFMVKSPWNTEAEWKLVSITSTVGASSTPVIVVSASNPISSVPAKGTGSFGALSAGGEGNAFEGIMVCANNGAPLFPLEWQPLGRGAYVYFTSNCQNTDSIFALIAFRRKLDHAIPTPPRRKPHTHTQPQSRRGARTFMAGFEAQYPHDKYIHEEIPVTQDTAAIGNVENMTPAQQVLAKLRNGGR